MKLFLVLIALIVSSPALALTKHCQTGMATDGTVVPLNIPSGWSAISTAPHDGTTVELYFAANGVKHYGLFHWAPTVFMKGKLAWVGQDPEHQFTFYIDTPCLFYRLPPGGGSISGYVAPDGKTSLQRLCEAGHKEHCKGTK